MTLSNQPDNARLQGGFLSFDWLSWPRCLVIVLAVFVLTSFALALAGLGLVICILLALVPAAAFLALLNSMRVTAEKRRTMDWQWLVHRNPETASEHLWESERMFDSFRHVLVDSLHDGAPREDQVYVFKRFHWFSLVPLLIGPAALAVGIPVLAWFYYYRLPWWAWVVLEVGAWLLMWTFSLKWRCTVIMVTNRYLRMVTRWPVLLAPFLRSQSEALALEAISTHDSNDSFFANLLGLGYGTLIADSASTHDEWANEMRFVQKADRVSYWIGAAKAPTRHA